MPDFANFPWILLASQNDAAQDAQKLKGWCAMPNAELASTASVPEVTYFPEVECTVTVEDGLADTQVVYVADEKGNRQFLRVGKGLVVRQADKTYLPIGIVQLDYRGERALIELPYEADSGIRRLWIPFVRFRVQRDTP